MQTYIIFFKKILNILHKALFLKKKFWIKRNIQKSVKQWSNGLVVMMMDSQSRGQKLKKTTGWLQDQPNFLLLQCQPNK